MPGKLIAAPLAVAAALLAGQTQAQNGGSNVTGTAGLIAIDKLGNKIRFYDPVTLAEVKAIDAPASSVHELTVSYDHRRAYVPIYGDGIYGANPHPDNKILVIDLQQQAIADVIDLGDNPAPHGIAATRDGKLWVACDRQNRLLLVDPARKVVEASYQAPGRGAHFLVLLPDESKLYLSNKEGAVDVFDVRRRAFVATVPMARRGIEKGNGSGSESLIPTPDGKRLLVADNADNDIRVIDTATDREVAAVALEGRALSNPKRSRLVKLMFSPDGRKLVVTSYAGGQAWVIDAADLHRQTMVPVAKGPQGIAFTADSRTALVSSQDVGLLTRIDLASARAVGSAEGGTGIEVLAFY